MRMKLGKDVVLELATQHPPEAGLATLALSIHTQPHGSLPGMERAAVSGVLNAREMRALADVLNGMAAEVGAAQLHGEHSKGFPESVRVTAVQKPQPPEEPGRAESVGESFDRVMAAQRAPGVMNGWSRPAQRVSEACLTERGNGEVCNLVKGHGPGHRTIHADDGGKTFLCRAESSAHGYCRAVEGHAGEHVGHIAGGRWPDVILPGKVVSEGWDGQPEMLLKMVGSDLAKVNAIREEQGLPTLHPAAQGLEAIKEQLVVMEANRLKEARDAKELNKSIAGLMGPIVGMMVQKEAKRASRRKKKGNRRKRVSES